MSEPERKLAEVKPEERKLSLEVARRLLKIALRKFQPYYPLKHR